MDAGRELKLGLLVGKPVGSVPGVGSGVGTWVGTASQRDMASAASVDIVVLASATYAASVVDIGLV